MKTLNIIGCGRAAKTLARLWTDAGVIAVGDVLTRSRGSAEAACTFVGGGRPVSVLGEIREADLWLVGTPDREIAAVASALAERPLVRAGDGVFHLSGFTPSSALAPLVAKGGRIASVHPVVSFSEPERVLERFSGMLCGVEGDVSLAVELRTMFERIGGECFSLKPECKPLYHAGSVFASNFLVVIMDVARKAYVDAGVTPEVAEKLVAPLARGSLESVLALGGVKALTGPAARGDAEVVRAQHAAVSEWDAGAAQAYAALTELAFRLAAERPR